MHADESWNSHPALSLSGTPTPSGYVQDPLGLYRDEFGQHINWRGVRVPDH
jgi:hypothetical protein